MIKTLLWNNRIHINIVVVSRCIIDPKAKNDCNTNSNNQSRCLVECNKSDSGRLLFSHCRNLYRCLTSTSTVSDVRLVVIDGTGMLWCTARENVTFDAGLARAPANSLLRRRDGYKR